jgi:hypothetical protein
MSLTVATAWLLLLCGATLTAIPCLAILLNEFNYWTERHLTACAVPSGE